MPFTPEPICGITLSYGKRCIKHAEGNKLKLYWENIRKQAHSKYFLDGLWPKRSAVLLLMNMSTAGLHTGHCRWNKHLFNLGFTEEPTCRMCGLEDKTTYHIVCQCNVLAKMRYLHFGCDLIIDPKLSELIDLISLNRFTRPAACYNSV